MVQLNGQSSTQICALLFGLVIIISIFFFFLISGLVIIIPYKGCTNKNYLAEL